jgi:hypothetical protein
VVTARRRPASGTVVWTVLLNGARDNGDRAIWAAVAAAIADLQAQTGICAEADAGELARQLKQDHLGPYAGGPAPARAWPSVGRSRWGSAQDCAPFDPSTGSVTDFRESELL